jgi:cap2 methyltransferase
MTRKKYYKRTKEIRNVIHWGQRKLILSEIEFLTRYIKTETNKKPIYVIYAGGAPGTHILYLTKMFPDIYFELYDPREFSTKLTKCNRINTHIQYFTNETANKWKSIEHIDKNILFISDIRTSDVNTMNLVDVENRVSIDNQNQLEWYTTMEPQLTMLKFRLPYDSDKKTEYLNGDIYIQPYAPQTSTETRLIVSKGAKMKKYDDRKFEEQLFHFNNHERILNYDNILYNTPVEQKHGITNNYDGASEIHILENYINLKPYKGCIDKIIIGLISTISLEISSNRTLYSEQPIQDHKKNIMKTLQRDGFIPKKAVLNQTIFNIYIIPRYSYFNKLGYFN